MKTTTTGGGAQPKHGPDDYCHGSHCPLRDACAHHYDLSRVSLVTVIADQPYDPDARSCPEYLSKIDPTTPQP
jgi:hypothetical protein